MNTRTWRDGRGEVGILNNSSSNFQRDMVASRSIQKNSTLLRRKTKRQLENNLKLRFWLKMWQKVSQCKKTPTNVTRDFQSIRSIERRENQDALCAPCATIAFYEVQREARCVASLEGLNDHRNGILGRARQINYSTVCPHCYYQLYVMPSSILLVIVMDSKDNKSSDRKSACIH